MLGKTKHLQHSDTGMPVAHMAALHKKRIILVDFMCYDEMVLTANPTACGPP